MFGTVDVVAQSAPVHGAFDPWLVLLWLALMAGCLLIAGGVVALVQFFAALLRKRSHAHSRLRISASTNGTSNT